ncbi:hypothetical protein DID76_01590, partial [Candidatus Marinamargulisbacteria bacterium SCGC AG-414-C22]
MNQTLKNKLNTSITKLQSTIQTKNELAKEIIDTLKIIYKNSTINIYLLNKDKTKIDTILSSQNLWPIPQNDIYWLKSTSLKRKKNNATKTIYSDNVIYIKKRGTDLLNDNTQLKIDQKTFNYVCSDGLFLKIQNKAQELFGIIFIHNWEKKQPLEKTYKNLDKLIKVSENYINKVVNPIENMFIHDTLQSLISDKNKLKLQVQEDEEDLKRRLLELSTLNDASYLLSSSLYYKDAINIIMDSISKVIRYDTCFILITASTNKPELFSRLKKPLKAAMKQDLLQKLIKTATPFFSFNLELSNINHTTETKYNTTKNKNFINEIHSFTNIPLKFKDEVIGFMTLHSEKKDLFQKNEISFLHTLANQLASNIGKLSLIKKIEKSKIASLIHNMTDPVILHDYQNNSTIFNPTADQEFNLSHLSYKNDISKFLENYSILNLYKKVEKSKKAITKQHILINEKVYSVNISPINSEKRHIGTILVFRDITSSQKIDRIKTQRLEAIEKVNLIINHIQNLNHLLTILIEYILNIANAEMGSIQLKSNDTFVTKVHSNFPDKVRRNYKFYNNRTISDEVIEKKETIFIENYFSNEHTQPNVKILIDSYLCIPIIINEEIIGIINIARKFGSTAAKITEDDINTLTTITTLSGTAIQNGIYYEKKLKNEKFEQELAIAKNIQQNLLPQELPNIDKFIFSVISKSAHYIGGDFYDFIEFSKDQIGIVIADIVGKGIPAGLYMATLKSILKSNIKPYFSPKKALSKINTILFNDPVIDKFTPIFYGIINKKNMTFTYSNAGQEPPVLFRDNKFIQLDTTGFPVGAYQKADYEEHSISIKNHDLFFFLTDGIIETKNKDNISFGYRRLYNFIKKNYTEHPKTMINNLEQQLNTFAKDNAIEDDHTMIIAKVNFDIDKKDRDLILDSKEIKVFSDIKDVRTVRNVITK